MEEEKYYHLHCFTLFTDTYYDINTNFDLVLHPPVQHQVVPLVGVKLVLPDEGLLAVGADLQAGDLVLPHLGQHVELSLAPGPWTFHRNLPWLMNQLYIALFGPP